MKQINFSSKGSNLKAAYKR